jgi:hypothetical protein
MEAVGPSEMLVHVPESTHCHIPQDRNRKVHSHFCVCVCDLQEWSKFEARTMRKLVESLIKSSWINVNVTGRKCLYIVVKSPRFHLHLRLSDYSVTFEVSLPVKCLNVVSFWGVNTMLQLTYQTTKWSHYRFIAVRYWQACLYNLLYYLTNSEK